MFFDKRRGLHVPVHDASRGLISTAGVGVIGNGSSGVQIVSAIAETVGELHCFIRHPQYTVPAGFRAVSPRERQEINDNYDKIWDECWRSATGFGFLEASTPTMSVTPEERENIFESLWQVSRSASPSLPSKCIILELTLISMKTGRQRISFLVWSIWRHFHE